jgi:hypothetical protein
MNPDLDRAGQNITGPKLESLHVPYQRIWYDFNVADGVYTPGELHRAGKVVRPRGLVQYYSLQWPALEAGVLNLAIRSATMSCYAPQYGSLDESTAMD